MFSFGKFRKYFKRVFVLGIVVTLFPLTVIANNFNSFEKDDVPMGKGPIFENSTIMGTVYVDSNQNGIQDEGEQGVSGAVLVTVDGLIVTTDQFGRYSLPDISGGRNERGTNFIIKLDKDSLPENYQIISNPTQVIRLTPGLPQQIDFRVIAQ